MEVPMSDAFSDYLNKDLYGVLRLPLKDRLSLYQVGSVFTAISDTYQSSLWLSVVQNSKEPETIRKDREPLPEEDLIISQVEIGTPNFAELVGLLDHLVPVVGMVVAVLGLPLTFALTRKAWIEGTKLRVEKRIAELELLSMTEPIPDGIRRQAQEVRDNNKIDQKTLEEKLFYDNRAREYLRRYYSEVAYEASLYALEKPVSMSWNRTLLGQIVPSMRAASQN